MPELRCVQLAEISRLSCCEIARQVSICCAVQEPQLFGGLVLTRPAWDERIRNLACADAWFQQKHWLRKRCCVDCPHIFCLGWFLICLK